jgi:predicted nucleic acid-binding protein
MKNGLVISDAGPIFSLAIVDKLEILDEIFEGVFIPSAVWEEVTRDKSKNYFKSINEFFKDRVKEISGFNDLTFVMDYGESESVILYKELNADFLLIDDKKARSIAENFGINCIGTIGVLSTAKGKGVIEELRPLFEQFLKSGRYYSVKLLNTILKKHDEKEIEHGG